MVAVRGRRAWLRQERGAGVGGDRDGPVPAGRRDVVVLLVAVQRVVVPVRWPRLLLAAGAAADERETAQDAAHGADGLDHVFLSFFLFFFFYSERSQVGTLSAEEAQAASVTVRSLAPADLWYRRVSGYISRSLARGRAGGVGGEWASIICAIYILSLPFQLLLTYGGGGGSFSSYAPPIL